MTLEEKVRTYLAVILRAETLEEAKREARLAIQLIDARPKK
jgi:hypothetical protein